MKAKNLDEHQGALDHLKRGVTHLKQKLEDTKAKFTFSLFGLFTFTIPFFGKSKLEKFIEEYTELEQQITRLKARSADTEVSEEMQLLVDHEKVVLGEDSSKRNFHLEAIKAAVAKRDQSGEQVLEADGGDGVSGLSSSRKNYEKLPDSLKAELKAAVEGKRGIKED